jgi:hypothetical protein
MNLEVGPVVVPKGWDYAAASMRKSEEAEGRGQRAEDFEFDGSWINVKTKGLHLPEPLLFMVPKARIELARTQGPLDFESSASTNFTTPALFWLYI